MKPFAQWVGEMQGSIVDASHIGPKTTDCKRTHIPDTTKKVVLPDHMGEWSAERIKCYEEWLLTHPDSSYEY